MSRLLRINHVEIGTKCPLLLIAGPCVVESESQTLAVARGLASICNDLDVSLIFKASFDKANRTHIHSFRGPGLPEGLRVLERVKTELDLLVTTDIHSPEQAARVSGVVDLLQIPAFLCRQTDLLVAAGATGRPVNIKKGQFLSPWDMKHAVEKVRSAGDGGVILTERGAVHGYGDLVVDFRSMQVFHSLGAPACFDATHSLQQPGGAVTGGKRDYFFTLASAAIGAGADAIFAEVHADPQSARSDSATQMPLSGVYSWLRALRDLRRAALVVRESVEVGSDQGR